MQEPQEAQVRSLGRENPLEKEMATCSRILAWRIPMDRRAWQATVHGVAESQTRWKQISMHAPLMEGVPDSWVPDREWPWLIPCRPLPTTPRVTPPLHTLPADQASQFNLVGHQPARLWDLAHLHGDPGRAPDLSYLCRSGSGLGQKQLQTTMAFMP